MSSDVPHAPHGLLPEGGTVRPMTRWGTPVMHRPQADVTAYDDDLRTLVADMVATMYAADGVGLAACQIGVDLRVFVFDCPDESGDRTVGVVCNPVVTLPEGKDRKLEEAEEGCLSFPGAFIDCARPDFAQVDRLRGGRLAGDVRGRRTARPLPPARDRPHPRHRLRRPAAGQGAEEAAKIQEKVADEFPPDGRHEGPDRPHHAADPRRDRGRRPGGGQPALPRAADAGLRRPSRSGRRSPDGPTQLLDHPEDEPWVTGIIWDEDLDMAVGAPASTGRRTPTGWSRWATPSTRTFGGAGTRGPRCSCCSTAPSPHPDVRVLRATISPDNEPSLNLIASFGLERNGEQWDEEDGLEWIFEIPTDEP